MIQRNEWLLKYCGKPIFLLKCSSLYITGCPMSHFRSLSCSPACSMWSFVFRPISRASNESTSESVESPSPIFIKTFQDLRLSGSGSGWKKENDLRPRQFRPIKKKKFTKSQRQIDIVRGSLFNIFQGARFLRPKTPKTLGRDMDCPWTYEVKRGALRDQDLKELSIRRDVLITGSEAPLSMVSLDALSAFLSTHGKSMTHFNLQNAICLTEESFDYVMKLMPNLRKLTLHHQHQIKEKNIMDLLKICPRLSSLKLMTNNYLTKSLWFTLLSQTHNFSDLLLDFTYEKPSQEFSGIVTLSVRNLTLIGHLIKDSDLDLILGIKNLSRLTLNMTKTTDAGVINFLKNVGIRPEFKECTVLFQPDEVIGHRRLAKLIKQETELKEEFKISYDEAKKSVLIRRKEA